MATIVLAGSGALIAGCWSILLPEQVASEILSAPGS